MKMEEKGIISMIAKYSIIEWQNWITDIFEHGIAFPISKLSSEGDVLVDIIDFMKKSKISVFKYEEALSNRLSKEFYQNENEIIFTAIYDDGTYFEDNLAIVQLNHNWGFINENGTQYWED